MHQHIQQYLDDVKASKAEGTFQTRQSDLRVFNEFLADKDMEPTEVDAWIIHQFLRHEENEGYADWTVQSRYQSVKNLYSFLAGTRGLMDESPFEGDGLKRSDFGGRESVKSETADIVYIRPEEMEELAENVPQPKLRNELMVRLLWQTGLRRSEIAIIELDNIDREGRSIEVWSPKTEDWRTVYYQPSLDTLLTTWIDRGSRLSFAEAEESDYLFPTERAEHIVPMQVNEIVKKAAENAEIQEVMNRDAMGRPWHRVTAHALRHGHAVESLKSGIDVRTVQKHLGHTDIETTMEYLQLIDDDVKEAYQRFGTSAETSA
ncbi:tyrosine-type recombinase/integrase [Natrinema altunense]|uniref:Site-specific recombinase xerd n=1 Tax=Natrinema altunense (strain JCM 12890 / CGMCC 1.3731 / AJ2) TaxID=1227494 RepID=L9ZIP9_NATA2|nr:tyrosine-type recombinase/integrase [Natrinema altunense]ELY84998.1 site-specific recombinase xerd [Natrinema altunense JCM 12890]